MRPGWEAVWGALGMACLGNRTKDEIPAQLVVLCCLAHGSDLPTEAWARVSGEDKVPISAVAALGCALSSCCWDICCGEPLLYTTICP